MNLINVSTTFILVSCCAFLVGKISAQNRFRSRTATTTTEEPLTEIELTLADRELVLQERELNFKTREETLTIREAAFREREERLTTREKNLEAREQNTLRGSCSNNEDTTPPPDYTLVRYDETMMQYLEIGSTKYCAENMRFFADPDNETAGACDCDYHECSRPLLYSDKYKQCFWAWSQGPCEQGEWYTYDEGYSPICEPNPCPASDAIAISNYYFLNAEDGKCYQTGSKGYCTKPRQRLLTAAFEPIPSCRSKSVCYPLTRPATQECVPGSKRHYDEVSDMNVLQMIARTGRQQQLNDNIWNDDGRDRLRVTTVEEARTRRLRSFGHVQRMQADLMQKSQELEAEGDREADL